MKILAWNAPGTSATQPQPDGLPLNFWGSGSGQLWDVVLEKPSLGTTGIFYTNYSCDWAQGDVHPKIDSSPRIILGFNIKKVTWKSPPKFPRPG